MLVLFKKHKQDIQEEDSLQHVILALTSLVPLCNNGRVSNDAFRIEEKDIYIYADIVSLKNNVAQIVYQLHHAWLDEPIVESVAASGENIEDAIHQAAKSFVDNILAVYLQALDETSEKTKVRVIGNKPQDYFVYRGVINGVGRRVGVLEGDFWDMLQDDILASLSDRKAHWIRVFTSKNKDNIICEMRIDGHEVSALSEVLLSYAETWECIDTYHSEKQGILLIQDSEADQINEFTMEEIKSYTNKTISLLEKCHSKEDHANVRMQLFKLCKDESLTYEILHLIPELYCMHAYAKVEFEDKLYLICKGKETQELRCSQLYSFAHIKSCVDQHLMNDNVNRVIVNNVLCYSANAKAILKALDEGNHLDELLIPGIGILIPKNYILR